MVTSDNLDDLIASVLEHGFDGPAYVYITPAVRSRLLQVATKARIRSARRWLQLVGTRRFGRRY